MTYRRNIIASYVAQIYVVILGIIILPQYLKYMGPDAYGLVGFFTMIQAWFNLLDMGLTPTVSRETARFLGGVTSALNYRRLARALQIIFFTIALAGGGTLFFCSGIIAAGWLNSSTLSPEELQIALKLIAVVVAMRWMSGLYRGFISGSERLVWLSSFNAVIATLRFLGVLPLLIWIDHTPTIFFGYQMLIATLELSILAMQVFNSLPAVRNDQQIGWSPHVLITPIRSVLKLSLSIAFTSSVWVLITQTDKLILSKLLPLVDYGYFTLAVLAASGVMIISGPISGALLPRMVRLQAEGNESELVDLYRSATQAIAVITVPTCLMLAFFAEEVLWAWTGNADVSAQTAPVLRLYALGNGFLAMVGFSYYLQFAKGDLSLHLRGNAIFVIVFIPLLTWATWTNGALGAGYAWLGANALFFFAWVPLVHKRFIKGLHRKWLLHDLCPIIIPALMASSFLYAVSPRQSEKLQLILLLIIYAGITFVASSIGVRQIRSRFLVKSPPLD